MIEATAWVDPESRGHWRSEDANDAAPGVYHLLSQEGCVLYVGQSRNIRRRIREHQLRGDIPFSSHRWRPVHEDELPRQEMREMLIHLPPYNKHGSFQSLLPRFKGEDWTQRVSKLPFSGVLPFLAHPPYHGIARGILELSMAQQGIDYTRLSGMLATVGACLTPDALRMSIAGGHFSATLMMQCLMVMGVRELRLPDASHCGQERAHAS